MSLKVYAPVLIPIEMKDHLLNNAQIEGSVQS